MNPLHHILDTVIVGVTLLTSAATAVLVNDAPTAERLELQLLLLPFIGSLCVSGGMIMLNPQPETRRIVIGRGIIALFCGVIGPQLIGLIHPSLASIGLKPIAALAAGGLIAGLAYVLSKPFFAELYQRADQIAKREADRLENRLSPPPHEEEKITPKL